MTSPRMARSELNFPLGTCLGPARAVQRLRIFHSKSFWYGDFLRARRVLNRRKTVSSGRGSGPLQAQRLSVGARRDLAAALWRVRLAMGRNVAFLQAVRFHPYNYRPSI
jgi:hypothetical protein